MSVCECGTSFRDRLWDVKELSFCALVIGVLLNIRMEDLIRFYANFLHSLTFFALGAASVDLLTAVMEPVRVTSLKAVRICVDTFVFL